VEREERREKAGERGIGERASLNYYRLSIRDVAHGGKGIFAGRTPRPDRCDRIDAVTIGSLADSADEIFLSSYFRRFDSSVIARSLAVRSAPRAQSVVAEL